MKKVFVSGCFDILHGGHVEFFLQAKSLGDYLIISVASDESLWIHKRRKSSIPIQHKIRLLQALKMVDKVVIGNDSEVGLDFKTNFKRMASPILPSYVIFTLLPWIWNIRWKKTVAKQ